MVETITDHRSGATPHESPPARVDADALAAALRNRVRGEVRFDRGSRALYATDASNYRQIPIGVVIPLDKDDVVATVAACREFGAPIVSRGGGTSLAGQACNVAVVIDYSKHMNRVLHVDASAREAVVEPGVVLDRLREAAEEHGLTFGPDPATHDRCTIGGMIGNNSCGVHSQMAGRTADNVIELEVLTYDGARFRVGATTDAQYLRIVREGGRRGEIYRSLRGLIERYAADVRARYPQIPRRVSGYNMDELLPERGFHVARAIVGSESTLVVVLEARLRLVPSPRKRRLVVIGYPDAGSAGDDVPFVAGFGPIGLEGMDGALVRHMKRKGLHVEDVTILPEGDAWILAEFGGDSHDECDAQADALMRKLRERDDPPSVKLFEDPDQEARVWATRESGLGATARVPGERDTWPGWEDSAVPPDRIGDYLRDLRQLLDEFGYEAALYGHWGQGCVHTRIPFDLKSAAGIAAFREFMQRAARLVVSYGGSLSGEHGDGQARAELLPTMFGSDLVRGMREMKGIWDPLGKMNPGKVVDAYRIDENLRLGADYRPMPVETRFAFPEDDHRFDRATTRCVGVGLCRRDSGGVMCPSYMATREEKHSTRGRARLLFEMLEGDSLTDGWRSEAVHDALDLCLSCKGCKSECPVNVDMATYKAEFMSHHYKGRLRPRHAYAFGLITWWARAASLAPRLANWAVRAPGLAPLAKKAAGIHPERTPPAFADETFSEWFRKRRPVNVGGRNVLLWPDTFNNHFHPAVLQAATVALEAGGFRVRVPDGNLCCGRPLYDYGFLGLARRFLEQDLDALRPHVRDGTPIVGVEPSCVATFRDELPNLLHEREDARRLPDQTFTLGEFLVKEVPDYPWPQVGGKAVVHGHCHHRSVLDFDADAEAYARMGLDHEILETTCCGMAGPFGFEEPHYDVSKAVAEHSLLPALRAADPQARVLTDGFSCRHQILDFTEKEPLHLAELIAQGLAAAPADLRR